MQTNYLNIKQGDIIVTQIHYSDLSGLKTRPALVISNSEYNINSGNIIVLSISSTQPGSKYDVNINKFDLNEGKLKVESKILTDYPAAISKNIISSKIGAITQNKLTEVKQKIFELYKL